MSHTGHEHRLDLEATLAFINTLEHSHGGDRDDLPTLAAALEWLVAHGAMHSEAADAASASGDRSDRLEDVRSLRGAMREVVDAAVAGRPPAARALATVNRVLGGEPPPELVATTRGVAAAHRHGPDELGDALSHVVAPLVGALEAGRLERLRVCANGSCRWVFYDTSPTRRRRWCDMATCGNRAKAARHRARRRERSHDDPSGHSLDKRAVSAIS